MIRWFQSRAAEGSQNAPAADKREGSHHFGSHAFDAPHAHARVITGGPAGASFDEVAARLTEELRAVGLDVVCAVTGTGGGGEGAGPTLPPVPAGGDPGGRAAVLTAARTGASSPCPASTAVVCHVFEASTADGPAIVVQAGRAACPETDGALVRALDALFRLPKSACPPGTYAWPPVTRGRRRVTCLKLA